MNKKVILLKTVNDALKHLIGDTFDVVAFQDEECIIKFTLQQLNSITEEGYDINRFHKDGNYTYKISKERVKLKSNVFVITYE